MAVLLVAVMVPAYQASASHPTASLSGSQFEIDVDANLKVDDGGTSIDWANVADTRNGDAPTGRDDDSFAGGSKEDDTCPGTTTGSIPNNKSDLLNFGFYEEANGPGFLHLFWSRVQEPSGTTLMDFELNQSNEDCGNGVNRVRTVDDLLIEYRIEQGGASAQILAREWTGSAWGPEQDLTAIGMATGTINNTAIPANESDGLGALSARTFGEASIDLDFIFDEEECTSFGSAFLKSRSSTSFTSQLKDFIAPIPVNISNCGSIKVIKQTVPDGASGSFGFTTTGGLDPATFSLSDNGERLYSDVLAGNYSVSEDAAAGDLTSIVCSGGTTTVNLAQRKVDITVGADENVVCTFTNTLRGSILVHKVDDLGALLGGAGFTITPGNITMASTTAGVFCTDNLAFGTYAVTETTVPTGYNGAIAQNFAVNSTKTCAQKIADGDGADLSFTNSRQPASVTVKKVDDAGNPVAGATFTLYTDNAPVGGTRGAEDAATAFSCQTGINGQCTISNVLPVGNFWIVETGVPSGYTGAADRAITLVLGQNLDLTAAPFVNIRQFRVITFVCIDTTDTLHPSKVAYDGDALPGGNNTPVAGGAITADVEAAICGLGGSAVHSGAAGSHSSSVSIP